MSPSKPEIEVVSLGHEARMVLQVVEIDKNYVRLRTAADRDLWAGKGDNVIVKWVVKDL